MALDRQRPVSLVLFDIDHFKSVNDSYGHLGGDRVLMSIARALKDNVRESDMPCRYGGDEFLVLLAGMDGRAAAVMAERMRTSISATPVSHGDTQIAVTVSIGVTSAIPDESANLEALIERADRALYAAKQAGRDRVVSRAPVGL
jgi:diguanylate cyclase (GGDEF)-like protein